MYSMNSYTVRVGTDHLYREEMPDVHESYRSRQFTFEGFCKMLSHHRSVSAKHVTRKHFCGPQVKPSSCFKIISKIQKIFFASCFTCDVRSDQAGQRRGVCMYMGCASLSSTLMARLCGWAANTNISPARTLREFVVQFSSVIR